jgi:hypothetical protein
MRLLANLRHQTGDQIIQLMQYHLRRTKTCLHLPTFSFYLPQAIRLSSSDKKG